MSPPNIEELKGRAAEVAALLKILSHPNRLLVACQLMGGEQSVGEIEARAGVRQPVLSRDLAILRRNGLVSTRRSSKMIYYRLADDRLSRLVSALCDAFARSQLAKKRSEKKKAPSALSRPRVKR